MLASARRPCSGWAGGPRIWLCLTVHRGCAEGPGGEQENQPVQLCRQKGLSPGNWPPCAGCWSSRPGILSRRQYSQPRPRTRPPRSPCPCWTTRAETPLVLEVLMAGDGGQPAQGRDTSLVATDATPSRKVHAHSPLPALRALPPRSRRQRAGTALGKGVCGHGPLGVVAWVGADGEEGGEGGDAQGWKLHPSRYTVDLGLSVDGPAGPDPARSGFPRLPGPVLA